MNNKSTNLFLLSISFLICLIFISCNQETPDKEEARIFAEKYIDQVNSGNYENLSEWFSDEMKSGESDDARNDKLKKLAETMGPVKEYKLLKSDLLSPGDEDPYVQLDYKVVHERLVTLETYKVKKESGTYKIAGQNVVNNPE
jgi:hypothetical protein